MSKTIYDKINEEYIKSKTYIINNTGSFLNTYLESLELLKIISNKN